MEAFLAPSTPHFRVSHSRWSQIHETCGLGRHGRAHVALNNYILNTRFGINLCAPDCLAEGNVVANFSADGIRVTRDGDDKHDDGIQAFLFNVRTGTLGNVTLRGNIILARETDDLPVPNELQGIGCPAWDFQWFVERPRVGRRYQLVMRAVYVPVPEEADESGVRAHVGNRAEEARKSATPPGAALGF